MASKKKPTAKQITKALQQAAKDYEHQRGMLWEGILTKVAAQLGVEEQDIEEEFGALT